MHLLKSTLQTFKQQKNIKHIMQINLIFFVFFMVSDSVDVYIPLVLRTMSSMEGTALGIFQSITFIVRMLAILYIGKLCFKNKKVILLTTVIFNILLLIIFEFQNSLPLFFIVFGLLVVTRSVVNIVMNPAIARLCTKETLGVTFGIRDIFLSLGSFVGLVVSGILSKTNNTLIFLLFIIICLVLLFLLIIMFKAQNAIADVNCADEENRKEEKNSITTPKRQFSIKTNYIVFCTLCIFISVGTSFQLFMPTIGAGIGISDSNIFYFFSASTIVTAILSFFGGIIIDKFNKKLIFFVYITICLISVLLLIPKTELLFIASLVVIGIRGVLDNIEQVYFFDYFSDEENDFLWSIHSGVQMGLGFILPVFAGFIYDKSFTCLALFCLIAITVSYAFCCALRKITR